MTAILIPLLPLIVKLGGWILGKLLKSEKINEEDRKYLYKAEKMFRHLHLNAMQRRLDVEKKLKDTDKQWDDINSGKAKKPWEDEKKE